MGSQPIGAPFRDPTAWPETQLSVRLQTDPAGVLDVPSRPYSATVIHVGRSVHIACDRAGRRHQGVSVHGDVDIIPCGTPSRCFVFTEYRER